ncbi:MAG: cyclodeaminase [Alphaproteobacteria bacterium]
MPTIRILSETELRRAVGLDSDTVDCVEQAFRLLATTDVAMPPIVSFEVPDYNGEVDMKTAYVPGIDSFAIKMSTGFFDNPKLGLPSLSGLMVLFSAKTGQVEAVLLDNGYLTDIRTAAAGAVAAKWLSREESATAGIIGTGLQARLQLKALTLVRPIKRALIWGRDPEKAAVCAEEVGRDLGIDAAAVPDIGDVMAAGDIVVTTTPSTEPLVTASQLRPGMHITAMGSDADYKVEIDPAALAAADLYVCDRVAQCQTRGELRMALETLSVEADAEWPELGDIIAGKVPGRTDAAQVTICDLTGTGVQDTAIATAASRLAAEAGAGTSFES